ncbi:MAG: FKBP-type peptidyl-prolyl cis-trans isomerase [Muribaculaceae bacterium]|nr:FKBP-type peptidyl-prolyl cis-trans isomerase [Muribaculaceae bacterium]
MKLKKFGFLLLPASLAILSSCMGDDDNDTDYSEWRTENLNYITAAEAEMLNGQKRYDKISPKWDPASFVLMQWHKRGNTSSRLKPLSTSSINIKYLLTNIEGDTLDSSYSQPDSLYTCQPCNMITGFWIATTNMEQGDSVTAIVPYTSGYGVYGSGSVLPYSTLIFQIKLDSIVKYDIRN